MLPQPTVSGLTRALFFMRKCGRTRRNDQGHGQSRSAGFQPAVSQCFQPADAPKNPARQSRNVLPIGNRRYSRLETCATPNQTDFVSDPDQMTSSVCAVPTFECPGMKIVIRPET